MKIRGVLFDVIGTTVIEKGNTVMDCFENAFASLSIPVDMRVLRMHRGKDKNEMIRAALRSTGRPEELAPLVYEQFKAEFKSSLERFETRPGAIEIFRFLNNSGIKLGVGTGMERELLTQVLAHLKWDVSLFDYIGAGPELPNQRPRPDMILDMMKKTGVKDPTEMVKVGDTIADIQEGKNAGVRTIVVLAGTQPEAELCGENPDFAIRLLEELPQILA